MYQKYAHHDYLRICRDSWDVRCSIAVCTLLCCAVIGLKLSWVTKPRTRGSVISLTASALHHNWLGITRRIWLSSIDAASFAYPAAKWREDESALQYKPWLNSRPPLKLVHDVHSAAATVSLSDMSTTSVCPHQSCAKTYAKLNYSTSHSTLYHSVPGYQDPIFISCPVAITSSVRPLRMVRPRHADCLPNLAGRYTPNT